MLSSEAVEQDYKVVSLIMFLKAVYSEMKELLAGGGIEMPALEARLIIAERCGYEWSDIVAKGEEIVVSPVRYDAMRRDVAERLGGVPLSRIYNKRGFWGLEFALSPDTLDPRPDTELIIELALQRFSKDQPPAHILDLGTGSGCILISLLCEFVAAQGVGVDLSAGALDMACYNAQQNDCAQRAVFVHGSWWDALDTGQVVSCAADDGVDQGAYKVQQKFDLIVSNPPYIANHKVSGLSAAVRNHDPILSLDGGADGLDAYKIIFSGLKKYLSSRGIALCEIGYDQQDDVMRLSEEHGFALRTVHTDLAGNPRVVEISCGDK
ncbi:MAG: peptide chain release factor N(5)-glutamine methyltransferase [Alphaproteobacteria bacterium]